MKLIPLSKNSKKNKGKYFAEVDDEDYDFLIQWNWHRRKGGSRNKFYAARGVFNGKNNSIVFMHSILCPSENLTPDHIDGNGLNNTRANLRLATRSQNAANKSAKTGGTSKYLGVSVCHSKKTRLVAGETKTYHYKYWEANISKDGKKIHIGKFKVEEDAARAYDAKAMELHMEFANPNFQ